MRACKPETRVLENPVSLDPMMALGAYYNAMARREQERGLVGYAVLDESRRTCWRCCRDWLQRNMALANNLVWAIAGHDGYMDGSRLLDGADGGAAPGHCSRRALDIEYDESAHRRHLGLTLALL